MGTLGSVFRLGRAGAFVAARRLIQGPRRPSWSWGYETAVEAFRRRAASGRSGDIAAARCRFEALVRPTGLVRRSKVEKVDAGGVPAEWVSPPGAEPERILLYLHGGAYCVCSLNTHRDLVARIAQASGARALALDYRLAPEHPFPAALEDAVAAWRWLLDSGVEPSQVVIAGDSAGGGLSVATLLRLRELGEALPAGAALLSPWVDLEGTGETVQAHRDFDYLDPKGRGTTDVARLYAGMHPLDHPLVSPIHADLSGLPPMLVQAGGAELLLSEAQLLAERARQAGVDVTLDVEEDMVHVWHFLAPVFKECRPAIERVGAFARAQIDGGSALQMTG